MDHDQVLELIPIHALNALEGAEARDVESHLATCEDCTAELAVHRSVAAGLIPDEPAPSQVWDRITAEIAEPETASPVVRLDETRRSSERSAAWLISVAALVALILGAVAIFQAVTSDDLTGARSVGVE